MVLWLLQLWRWRHTTHRYERESSLHVTNTTYSGLQEHRIIVYTATGYEMEQETTESSLQVTKTTYSGLQEHRSIVYTATGQKAKPKVHMSTKTTDTGNSSKTPEACGRETEEHKLKTAV
jgi:hypothetical protein